MARKFLTAEDVRRASGAEIVVDATTVVTPQALETAQAAGIVVRTADGAYEPPRPDRGPDAPHPDLPEPIEEPLERGLVVTAVGRNRPGVLAEITTALSQFHANVHDLSQKVVKGYFHLVITIEMGPSASLAEAKGCLECLGGQDDYVVRVMHERVFRFMHRI